MTRCARYHKQHDAQTGLDAIDANNLSLCVIGVINGVNRTIQNKKRV